MTRLFTKEYFIGEHYPDYFKTRWWKELNDALIDSNPDAKCWICGKTNTLLLHHVSYLNLFAEVLGIDIYILCFDCHTRTHFHLNGDKVSLEKKVLVKRMKILKSTYRIRNFRLGSTINYMFDRIFW